MMDLWFKVRKREFKDYLGRGHQYYLEPTLLKRLKNWFADKLAEFNEWMEK